MLKIFLLEDKKLFTFFQHVIVSVAALGFSCGVEEQDVVQLTFSRHGVVEERLAVS